MRVAVVDSRAKIIRDNEAIDIGTVAYNVSEAHAWSHVAGITAAQDFSARDVQMRPAGTPQFSLGKSFPGYTPLGPVVVRMRTPRYLQAGDQITTTVGDQIQHHTAIADQRITR